MFCNFCIFSSDWSPKINIRLCKFIFKEWVAALPDVPGDTDLTQPEQIGTQDLDNLLLGAEGKIIYRLDPT